MSTRCSLSFAGVVDQQGAEEPGLAEGATGGGGAGASGRRERLRQAEDVQRAGGRMAAGVVLGDAVSPSVGHGDPDRGDSRLRPDPAARKPAPRPRRFPAEAKRYVSDLMKKKAARAVAPRVTIRILDAADNALTRARCEKKKDRVAP